MAQINSTMMHYDDASGELVHTGKSITVNKVVFRESVHAAAKNQTKSEAYTLAEGDSGQITYVDTTAVITLPATVVGMTFTLVNAGEDGTVQISLSPNSADKVMGAGLTSADDKDVINTLATAKKGDLIEVVGDGVNGWYITRMHGTWAREA